MCIGFIVKMLGEEILGQWLYWDCYPCLINHAIYCTAP